MMRTGSLKMKKCMKVRFREIPHHIIMKDNPLILSLNSYSQHRQNCRVFYMPFFYLETMGLPIQKKDIIDMASIMLDHEIIMT